MATSEAARAILDGSFVPMSKLMREVRIAKTVPGAIVATELARICMRTKAQGWSAPPLDPESFGLDEAEMSDAIRDIHACQTNHWHRWAEFRELRDGSWEWSLDWSALDPIIHEATSSVAMPSLPGGLVSQILEGSTHPGQCIAVFAVVAHECARYGWSALAAREIGARAKVGAKVAKHCLEELAGHLGLLRMQRIPGFASEYFVAW